MADELEKLWRRFNLTEEEDERIELGSSSTKAAREIGINCLVMKVLTQRSINFDALRKDVRMMWKPNKGILISEIEEDLFLVEFGDGRDKKKVLDMRPWNYDKQLILFQDFEGDQIPKEISLKWSPFWVQISNLPLKSKTWETGWSIGSKLGEVLDIDVPETSFQWGRYLRVRVMLDATKKLVRGKKVTIEGAESRWVSFKYERLSNFCYNCGLLNHGIKDCPEIPVKDNQVVLENLQYRAWLRGEPMKKLTKEPTNNGALVSQGVENETVRGVVEALTVAT
ncbi:hypothetical protein SO802_029351 [Lithocarpus litseifolius]|uniref:CCHC-type domain-containing protein n=1 Tax=Lithocarpus litseifolius TaxID=425828 RepID=A0AAW2BTF5_9ROSI